MKMSKKRETVWKGWIWSFRNRKSLSNGWTHWSQLWSRVSAHELFTLAGWWQIPSQGSHDVLFILSGSAGRNDGVVCQSDSLGLLYSCLFSTSVPCWTAVSVSASLRSSCLSDKSPEPGNHHSAKKRAEGPQTESGWKLRRLYIYIVALLGFPDTKVPVNVSIWI